MFILKWMFALGSLLPAPLLATSLVLNAAPVSSEFTHANALLVRGYENIGVTLKFTHLPYIRSAISANVGVIDGLDLRLETHTESYHNLIRVEVPLLLSKTILVINRKLCGECEVSELRSLAVVAGFTFPEQVLRLDNSQNLLIELAEHEALFRFFQRNRVNAIITSDVFLPDYLRDNIKYRYVEIARQNAFHYLHKSHLQLAIRLQRSLAEVTAAYAEKEIRLTQPEEGKSTNIAPHVDVIQLNRESRSAGS
jgi:hypothetical protein